MVTASLPGMVSRGRRTRELDEVAGGDVDMGVVGEG
jgi:hypothetical protein